MSRLVCDCMNVYEDELKEAFIEFNGDEPSIKDKTQAAIACRRCLHESSEEDKKVDICFPNFMKELREKD